MVELRTIPGTFIHNELPEPEEQWRTVQVEALRSFFTNPAKFLVNRRLQIQLEEGDAILEETESFDVKGLEKYLLEQELVEKRLGGRDLRDFLSPTRASGRLPHGTVGECIYKLLSRNIEGFAQRTRPYLVKTALNPLSVDMTLSGFRLTGRIGSLYSERLLHYRYAAIKPKDHLRIWIAHLVLNSLRTPGYPQSSLLIGLGKNGWTAWEYLPVEKSDEFLEKLLKRYWQGLTKPLHFFPESSWEYAYLILKSNKSDEESLQRARKTWGGGDYGWRENDDPHYQLCFRNMDPMDSEFQRIALEVYEPLFTHQKEVE
jgi:exodeoxyribonuclease V gamma subunit